MFEEPRGVLGEEDLDLRVVAPEVAEQIAQVIKPPGWSRRARACQPALRVRWRAAQRVGHRAQRLVGVAQESVALWRQFHAARVALEQGAAGFAFEFEQAPRQCDCPMLSMREAEATEPHSATAMK